MSERPPISPRSPRAALEPERVPPPPRRSERARNPFVVIGNAIITIVLLALIGAGTAYYYGRQVLEAPGPLLDNKVVNIPARAGKRDIADVLQREGVITVNPWLFIGGVFAMQASSELKPGEYSFKKSADLRTDRGAFERERPFLRLGPRNPARGHAAARDLQFPARHHARAGDPAHAA
jgi:UPF0755 protein